jgi:hypothetical protein
VNGLIELHRRVALGFRNRDNYRLRMLLIGGGLTHPHLNKEEPVNEKTFGRSDALQTRTRGAIH